MKLGMVVFGLGIAGRVRVRDISSQYTNFSNKISWELIGYVSRRNVEVEGVIQLSEDEVFNRSDVHAVIICTENALHESVARKALTHGKHVLVEFPVSTTLTGARELYRLAEDKGLVLHEENIALLSDSFLNVKSKLEQNSSSLVSAELKLTGSYNGWIENMATSGGPFCSSISQLETMYELLGSDIWATGATLEKTDEGFTASATLTCAKCSDITVSVRRTKEKSPRCKELRLVLSDGSVIDDKPTAPASTTASKKPGMFMQDFLLFIEEVERGTSSDRSRQRALHCMEVAEKIHSFMGL